MLKKMLSNIGALILMALLGFSIFHFLLQPNFNNSQKNHQKDKPTQSFFAAKIINIQGTLESLQHYQGKIIVLNFWATWCPPCREEMPELAAIHRRYQDKNVTVIGIAVDELSLVQEFLHTMPVKYPILVDEEAGMSIASKLGNDKSVLPYTLIIDANGNVVKTFMGRIDQTSITKTLDQLLQ